VTIPLANRRSSFLAKPAVNDEIRMGLRYFRLSLFESLPPKIYAEVVDSLPRDLWAWKIDQPNSAKSGSVWAHGLAATAMAIQW